MRSSTETYTPYNTRDDGSEVDGLSVYYSQMHQYNLLTKEQECDLATRAQAGDRAAFDAMCAANLRLVVSIAKGFVTDTWSLEDCIGDGNIGLMNAVRNFDVERGTRFSTHATWWIRQAIARARDQYSSLIDVPAYIGIAVKQLRRMGLQLEEQFHREPTADELAEAMHWPIDKVDMVQRAGMAVLSLSLPLSSGHTGAEDRTFADTLAAPEETGPERAAEASEARSRINRLLSRLTVRERQVIALRFGLDNNGDGQTLEGIAQLFGVCRERIRQIEAKALKKMRATSDEAEEMEDCEVAS